MSVRVVIVGDRELLRRLGNTPARMAQLHRAMEGHTTLIQGAVMLGTPVGVTSALRGSWQAETRILGTGLEGVVGSPLIYAEPIEHGRRAGAAMPPAVAIQTWVARKMGPEVSAFAVARSIGRKGIAPREMLRKAIEATRPLAQALWDRVTRGLLEGS